jgi:hypothetical protein
LAFDGSPIKTLIGAKTGTAEVYGKQDTSWLASWGPVQPGAPASDARFVVVGMVEQAGTGASAAAPMVRQVYEGLLGANGAPIVPGAAPASKLPTVTSRTPVASSAPGLPAVTSSTDSTTAASPASAAAAASATASRTSGSAPVASSPTRPAGSPSASTTPDALPAPSGSATSSARRTDSR